MRRRLVDLAAVGATAFAFAITHFPAPSGVGSSDADASRRAVRGAWHALRDVGRALGEAGAWVPDALASDKTIHFAIYLGPGALWALSLALRGRLDLRGCALLLAALALWAGLDELSQGLLQRDGELGDVLANVAGAAVGIGVVWVGLAGWRRVRGRWSTDRP